MAIEVTKTDEEGGTVSDKGKIKIRERIFTDAAGEVAVPESDARAAFLFSTPGKRVDREEAERLGIGRNGRISEPSDEVEEDDDEDQPSTETEEDRVAREEREAEEAKVAAEAEAASTEEAAQEKQAEKPKDKGLLGRSKNKGK